MTARIAGRLPSGVEPTFYDLSLQVDPEQDTFSGELTIAIQLEATTDTIALHARDLQIRSATIRSPTGDTQTLTISPAQATGSEPDYGEIELGASAPIPAGPAWLHFTFEGTFSRQMNGLYRVKRGDDWYAFTQFQVADARRCFPCFDEPGFKTPFRLTLMVPREQEAFANTKEAVRDTTGDWTTLRFEDTAPLPTYLFALCVGPLEVVRAEHDGVVPLRIIVPKGQRHLASTAAQFAPKLLRVLEDYFARDYPYSKCDLVAAPEFAAGAMENAGLIVFREELLLADPTTLTRSRERRIAEVIAHEIAHHWFGNLVTMEWWEDLWLNEAFATWIAAKTTDTWRSSFAQTMELLQIRNRVMGTDSLPAARKVRQEVLGVGDAEQAFDGLTYYKGAAILTMIERWIGEEAFQRGVRRYINTHAWRNARAEDLFRALDEESGKDVTGVCRSFLDKPGVPLVSVEGGDVRQSPYRLLGLEPPSGPDALWKIPVPVAGDSWEILESDGGDLTLGAHPNPGEWSYFRWDLPEAELSALAVDSEKLDVRSVLGLVDNAWAAVAAGRRSPAAYLDVLRALSGRQERPIVQEVVAGIGRIQSIWEETWHTDGLTTLVREVLGEHGVRLGFEPRKDEDEEDTILRPEILRVLGDDGRDEAVRDAARDRAARYLDDPHSVPADIAGVCLALSANDGHTPLHHLLSRLASTGDPEQRLSCLGAIGMVPGGEPLGAALNATLDQDFRAQDFGYVFRAALGRPDTRRQTFDWLKENFSALRKRLPDNFFVHFGSVIGAFRTAEERDEAQAFFESQKLPGGQRAIDQGVERANHSIALREAGRESVLAALG